ncbi:hypothetical protein WJX84_006725 [Apatococcus fuscideae]|uniref:SigF-like NTF2-like domain-containing protein n=1 Tax=Apatococcus fuscideae TaxID=2026836 RepID=A0AAW1T2U9_9CHLO
MDEAKAHATLKDLVASMQAKSAPEVEQLFQTYYHKDATLDHVALTVSGRENIYKVFKVWTTVAHHSPQVESVIYDQEEKKAMIYTTQHLTPAPLPFLTFTFPLITILQFTGADKKVIIHHQDVWTYDGAIMNVPILGKLYLSDIRAIFGRLWSHVGGML